MSATITADFPRYTTAQATPATFMPKPQSAQAATSAPSQPGDTIALGTLATRLSSDALKLFNSFAAEDRQKLADLVASGTLSGEELNDGLAGALKGQRKRQLWTLVFEKNQALPASQIDAPKEVHDAAKMEIEALTEERMRVLKGMSQRLGQPGAESQADSQAAYMRNLTDRLARLHDTLLMDTRKPFTLVGASGTFFRANEESASETSALAKLTKLGALSPGMTEIIATDAKRTAAENLIVRRVNQNKE